jgi:hypothetical protein
MSHDDLPLAPLPRTEEALPSPAASTRPPLDESSSRWLARLEVALVGLAAACVLLRLGVDVRNGTGSLWWGERLAFPIGVMRGIDIYPGAHSGPITGDVYGPMLAVFLLPPALVPTITGKMVLGQLSSLLVMLVPLAVLVVRVTRSVGGTLASAAVGMTMLTGMLAILPATNYQLTAIAADAPCLGFGMWAFVVLTRAPRGGYGRLALGAALVSLAMLTKPNGAFMALGLLLIVLRREGFVRAAIFGALFGLLTAALGLLIIRGTGSTFSGVWFNDVVIPSSQILRHDLHRFIRGMGKLTLPMFVLVAATLAPRWLPSARGGQRTHALPAIVLELWLLAWVLVPVSYLGRAKLGGDVNSFHAHYFAVAGTALAWIHAMGAPKWRLVRALAFAALALVAAPFGRGTVWNDWTDNTHQRVFAYLRAHGEGFFPWHPLATLEATGQYLHQSDGVYSRTLASRAPTHEEFMAHAPRHPAFIGLPRTGPMLSDDFVFAGLVARYYPDYVLVQAPAPELAALGLQIFAPVASSR